MEILVQAPILQPLFPSANEDWKKSNGPFEIHQVTRFCSGHRHKQHTKVEALKTEAVCCLNLPTSLMALQPGRLTSSPLQEPQISKQ
jgi:hypothetical protein